MTAPGMTTPPDDPGDRLAWTETHVVAAIRLLTHALGDHAAAPAEATYLDRAADLLEELFEPLDADPDAEFAVHLAAVEAPLRNVYSVLLEGLRAGGRR